MIKRSKKITDAYRNKILRIIDGWEGKLTWDLLIDAVEKRTGQKYTRQALDKHPEISGAYKKQKKSVSRYLSNIAPQYKTLSKSELIVALADHKKVKKENEQLKKENERLQLQLVVWAANARSHNVTESMLNKPLMPPDRNSTE